MAPAAVEVEVNPTIVIVAKAAIKAGVVTVQNLDARVTTATVRSVALIVVAVIGDQLSGVHQLWIITKVCWW